MHLHAKSSGGKYYAHINKDINKTQVFLGCDTDKGNINTEIIYLQVNGLVGNLSGVDLPVQWSTIVYNKYSK